MKPSWALRNWKPQLRSRLIDGKYLYIYKQFAQTPCSHKHVEGGEREREREREREGGREREVGTESTCWMPDVHGKKLTWI